MHAADADEVAETDAATRLAELTGEPSPDDDVTFEDEIPFDAADVAVAASGDVDAPGHERSASADEEPADDARPGQTTAERGPVDEGPVDEASAAAGLDEEAPGVDGPDAAVEGVPSSATDPVVSDALVADAEAVDALDRETDTRTGRS
jgi:hypothetical protein